MSDNPKKADTSDFAHNDPKFQQYILEGVSKTLLGQIFALSRPTVQKYLAGVVPDGYRGKAPIYKISRVAHLLLNVGGGGKDQDPNDPSRMQPDKRKDYWDAMMKQQKAMEQAGDLWPTEKVIDLAGGAFKQIKHAVNLFSDTVARETEVTPKQKKIILALSDALLADMLRRLVEDLRDPEDLADARPEDPDDWDR